MIRAPRLQRFQSPTDILNGRSKSLPTDLWSYKLAGPGGSQYGLDTIFADDTPPPDEANMALWIPVADGQRRDGVGDLLEVGGIDVERHRKNPLCLFDHGKKVDLPIGLFETRDNHRYTFEIDPVTKSAGGWAYFYQGKDLLGVNQGKAYDHALFCEQTFDMACKRLIRGGSIGYQVKAARELQPDYERGTPKGLHLLKILMLEGSLVVLPANMDTVGKLLSDGVCCGKSLSPYLVKSLEQYAPERKAMVTVPLANLPETTVPPAKWKPGLGATVKSVEGEEKAVPLRETGAADTVRRIQEAVQARPPRPPQPPKPPSGFHPIRMGSGLKPRQKELRQKYRTKAVPSVRTIRSGTREASQAAHDRARAKENPPKRITVHLGRGGAEKYPVAQAAPEGRGPKVKDLRAKYSKSVVPAHVARGRILNARAAEMARRRIPSENAIPERDTNSRRSDEIGIERESVPGQPRRRARLPSGPSGYREVTVPEHRISTEINDETINTRRPRHKDQPKKKVVPDEIESDSAFGRRLGIGPALARRDPRRFGPPKDEIQGTPEEIANLPKLKEGATGRSYTREGQKPYTMPPTNVGRGRHGAFAVKVKALRAKYKSGKREYESSGATEYIGTGSRPGQAGPKRPAKQGWKAPGAKEHERGQQPVGEVKPTRHIPVPKTERKKPIMPVASKPAKKPNIPTAAQRKVNAIAHSYRYPRSPEMQEAIRVADRTVGPKVQRQEEHRDTRRRGRIEQHEPIQGNLHWPRKQQGAKSLLDETDDQRAVILELNQKVVALARQLA